MKNRSIVNMTFTHSNTNGEYTDADLDKLNARLEETIDRAGMRDAVDDRDPNALDWLKETSYWIMDEYDRDLMYKRHEAAEQNALYGRK